MIDHPPHEFLLFSSDIQTKHFVIRSIIGQLKGLEIKISIGIGRQVTLDFPENFPAQAGNQVIQDVVDISKILYMAHDIHKHLLDGVFDQLVVTFNLHTINQQRGVVLRIYPDEGLSVSFLKTLPQDIITFNLWDCVFHRREKLKTEKIKAGTKHPPEINRAKEKKVTLSSFTKSKRTLKTKNLGYART